MQYVGLNVNRIRQKVADVSENLSILQNYARGPRSHFLGNPEAIRSAKYAFIVLCEACLAIANHLCARILAKAPDSYAETYLCLGEGGLLDQDLALRLAQMARFRNLLVHGYAQVDDDIVFQIMQNNLDDITQFLQVIKSIITPTLEGEEQ